jgi:hypothetical protein
MRHRFAEVDRSRNPGAMVSNEIILRELWEFLERRLGDQIGSSILDLGAGEKPYAPL